MVLQERMLSRWRIWCLVIKVTPETGRTKRNGAISSMLFLYTKVIVLGCTFNRKLVMLDAYKYIYCLWYLFTYFYSTCKSSFFFFTITCLPYKYRNTCLYEKKYIHFLPVCILSSRINTTHFFLNLFFLTPC